MKRGSGDQLQTAGGRVLGLTALGADRKEARKLVYSKLRGIRFEDSQLRTDIAQE